MNDVSTNTGEVFYTPARSYSLGWRHDYWREAKAQMDAAQLNLLLKRWNNPASQGNLYLKSGAGVAYADDEANAVAYGGLMADWEDRRWYLSYSNEFLAAGSIDEKAAHAARIGIAPYVGDAGALHTWLMLQADLDPLQDDTFSLTPLIRMFKGASLVEAGANLDGGVFFHLMHTF